MAASAIPDTKDAAVAAIDALAAARPTASRFANDGRYGDIITGWRAQWATLVARIADEVCSSRVRTASGQALRDLVASEFEVSAPTGAVPALGTVAFSKSPGMFATGVITRGTRIRRVGNTSVFPQQKDALYATLDDVYVPPNATSFTLALQATQPGSAANVTPTDGSGTPLTIAQQYAFVDPVFDPTLFNAPANTVVVDIGGGSDGVTDDDIKRLALSVGVGKYAPLIGALLTGSLAGNGVKRVAPYEDPNTGIANIYAADGSFNGSQQWANAIKQFLIDNVYVGFGCRVDVHPAALNLVAVQATITLRDGKYQAYTVDIGNAVRAALADYFTGRPDWYSFKLSAIRGVIARADKRIQTCTTAAVTTPGTGVVIPEPAPITSAPATLPFWALASNGLAATYANPF